MISFQISQIFLRDFSATSQFLRTAVHFLADQQSGETLEGIAFDNTHLVIQIDTIALQFIVDNLLRTLVANQTFTGKDLNVDHGTDHTGWNTQGRIFNVRRFFTENGAPTVFLPESAGFLHEE